MYEIQFTPIAEESLKKFKKNEPAAFKKVIKLIDELMEHPYIGTGKPEPLGSNRSGQWSRRITEKHRLVYKIEDDRLIVLILSIAGHYNDK
ncbi:MAG: Txe/YoeB family addiction module toxin [Prevotella sp.]|jgi:toxin YoeB|nr:Txe/YoeB family addiction module toxin [Prevotella sp.]MCI1282168.1 Txe/YoeB family addiction module toxin [Prevotella sp.]